MKKTFLWDIIGAMSTIASLIKGLKKLHMEEKTFFMNSTEGRLTCAASPKLGGNVRGKKHGTSLKVDDIKTPQRLIFSVPFVEEVLS